jgi:chromosome partition protein MukE
MTSRFAALEEVVRDERFPNVDLALRRGRHIDRDDGDWYAFITDAQDHLEPFYRRYGCELVTQSDGYFYLLPTGDRLSRRHLTAGEMLVGQILALLYLDPTTVQSGGVVSREMVLGRLTGLVGERALASALDPKRRRFDDERVVHEIIRKGVAQAIRRLARLGFIEPAGADDLRLRSPLLRFADPVRGLRDTREALERLIARGEVVELPAERGAEAAETEPGGPPETSQAEDTDDRGAEA